MESDDTMITLAMSGPQERLTEQDAEHLREFLRQVRSGGGLSREQRTKLLAITEKTLRGTS